MSRTVKLWAGIVGATVVIAAMAWGGYSAVMRFRETSSGQPQPAPPSDKLEGVPAPDNTVTTDEGVRPAKGGRP